MVPWDICITSSGIAQRSKFNPPCECRTWLVASYTSSPPWRSPIIWSWTTVFPPKFGNLVTGLNSARKPHWPWEGQRPQANLPYLQMETLDKRWPSWAPVAPNIPRTLMLWLRELCHRILWLNMKPNWTSMEPNWIVPNGTQNPLVSSNRPVLTSTKCYSASVIADDFMGDGLAIMKKHSQ